MKYLSHLWCGGGLSEDYLFAKSIQELNLFLRSHHLCAKPIAPLYGEKVRVHNSAPCARANKKSPLLSYHPNARWQDMPKSWRLKVCKEQFAQDVRPQSDEHPPTDKEHSRSKHSKNKKARVKSRVKEVRKKGFVPRTPKYGCVKPHGDEQEPILHSQCPSCLSRLLPGSTHCYECQFEDSSSITPDVQVSDPLFRNIPGNVEINRNELAYACCTEGNTDEERSRILSEDPVIEALEHMSKTADGMPESQKDQVDCWLGHAENLLIFAYQMYRAQGFADCFVAVSAYVKMYVKGNSIIRLLHELINEISDGSEKKEDVKPHGLCSDICDTWDLLKQHTIWKKISYLISAALSITVSSMKQITWSPLGLKLLHIEAAKEQLSAIDLIDACVKTFAWIAETGWQCMKEQSLAPLLYSDQKMREFNMLYSDISATVDSAMAGNVNDMGDFEKRTDRALELVMSLKKVKPDGTTAEWLQKKYEVLVDAKERIIAKRKNTSTRFAPIGWSLSGPTGVGKSTLAKLTMSVSLTAMEFSNDSSRIITLDGDDKYQSTYTSDIEGVFIDDFANMSANFASGSGTTPCAQLIKFFNNMAAQAIKAEIQQKGVVFIEFKCGVITTNVRHLDADIYSNRGESILRRFNHVCVRNKEEFRKKGSVSLDTGNPKLMSSSDGLLTDVWEIDVMEVIAYVAKEGRVSYRFDYQTVIVDGKPIKCENLDLPTYLKVVVVLSQAHKKQQDIVVNRAHEFESMKFCSKCYLPKTYCTCVEEVVKPHSFEDLQNTLGSALVKGVSNYINSFFAPLESINSLLGYSPVKKLTTNALAKEVRGELNKYATPWLVAVAPDWLHQTAYFQSAIDYWQSSAAYLDLRSYMHSAAWLSSCGIGYAAYRKSWTGFSIAAACSTAVGCGLYSGYLARKMVMRQEYIARRDCLPVYVKKIRDGSGPKTALVVASLAIGVKLLVSWNAHRIKTQSLDNPKDIDKSPGWFDRWFGSTPFSYSSSSAVEHTATPQAEATLEKNVWWSVFTRSDGSRTACNIVSLQNGLVLMPDNIFFPGADMTKTPCEWVEADVLRSHKGAGGRLKFKAQRSTYSYLFEDMDMRMIYVPNLDNVKSNWKFLPMTKPTGASAAKFLVKDVQARVKKEALSCKMGASYHCYKNFYGGSYQTTLAVDGSCMGLIIADCKQPVILGFHIGGTSTGTGHCQTLTLARYQEAVTSLRSQQGVVIMAQSTEMPQKQFGRDVLVSDKAHPNSKYIVGLGPEAAIQVMGSTKLRTVQKSTVVTSILSPHVEKVCGVSNKWGPPQLEPNWKAYNATLEHIVDPADQFVPADLERARCDWLKPLRPLMVKHAKEDDFSPLTMKQTVMGIEGKRFLDALVMKTSMGFPVFGPKAKHFEEIMEGEKLIDRITSLEILRAFDRLIGC